MPKEGLFSGERGVRGEEEEGGRVGDAGARVEFEEREIWERDEERVTVAGEMEGIGGEFGLEVMIEGEGGLSERGEGFNLGSDEIEASGEIGEGVIRHRVRKGLL